MSRGRALLFAVPAALVLLLALSSAAAKNARVAQVIALPAYALLPFDLEIDRWQAMVFVVLVDWFLLTSVLYAVVRLVFKKRAPDRQRGKR